MKVNILDMSEDPIKCINLMARNCYNSRDKFTKDNGIGFIKGIIKRGHDSMLEAAHIIFDIQGVSRSLLAQATRHRIGVTFAVQSQRYVNQESQEYVTPETLKYENNKTTNAIYENAIQMCKATYKELITLGVPKEDARYILPEATTTNICISFNFRALRHFLELRLDKHAQKEIRTLCQEMIKEMDKKGLQWLYEDIVEKNK